MTILPFIWDDNEKILSFLSFEKSCWFSMHFRKFIIIYATFSLTSIIIHFFRKKYIDSYNENYENNKQHNFHRIQTTLSVETMNKNVITNFERLPQTNKSFI